MERFEETRSSGTGERPRSRCRLTIGPEKESYEEKEREGGKTGAEEKSESTGRGRRGYSARSGIGKRGSGRRGSRRTAEEKEGTGERRRKRRRRGSRERSGD